MLRGRGRVPNFQRCRDGETIPRPADRGTCAARPRRRVRRLGGAPAARHVGGGGAGGSAGAADSPPRRPFGSHDIHSPPAFTVLFDSLSSSIAPPASTCTIT